MKYNFHNFSILKTILENSFWRNVTILAGGTIVAQAIMVLSLPILTRLYTPSDFSTLAVYSSVLGILSVASCLRYNIAISIPQDDQIAMDLLVVASGCGLVFTLLSLIPTVFFPSWFANILGQPRLQPYLWLLPIGVFFASAYDALQYWASRKKRFSAISRTRMVRTVFGVGTQVGMGAASVGAGGLLLGHMLLSCFGFLPLARSVLKNDRALLIDLKLSRLKQSALEYRRYPIYSVPEALLNTASAEIPILIVAAVSIGPDAGYLMLAMRVMGLPMSLIGSSISQIYLAEGPQKHHEGVLAKFTKDTMVSLLKIGVIPMALVGLISPFIFPIVFGAEWVRSGIILALITPMFILQFLASPISAIPHILGRVDWAVWVQAPLCIFRIGIVWIIAYQNPSWSIAAFVLSGILYYVGMLLFYNKLINNSKHMQKI